MRTLFCTSNVDSFARKLLDSEKSCLTKHMFSNRSPFRVIVGCCFYGVDFSLFSWQFILLVLWMSFVLKTLITSFSYSWEQKHYGNPRLAGLILIWSKWMYKLYVIDIYRSKSKVTIWKLVDALSHLKSHLGVNRTYNSNSTAWEFQIYWTNVEKYRTKGSNKISYNRQRIHSVD